MNLKVTRSEAGFSLIELMVVVAIVGILASIAIPSYVDSINRGNRTDARTALLKGNNWITQQFTLNNSYLIGGAQPAVPVGLNQSPESGTAKYAISFAAGVTATAYVLQAVPVVADAKCATYTLDQDGTRGLSGTYSSTAVSCWTGKE